MILKNYLFEDPSKYDFDPALIDFTALQKPRLKSQIPANATFGAAYTNNINGNWGGGVLAGTAFGGAAVSGGKLDLAHADKRYVNYACLGNANSQQTGCVRLKYTPNYSGAPASDRWIFSISKAHNDIKNQIALRHRNSASALCLHVYNSAGVLLVETLWTSFSPVAGTEYELEINWDLTVGAIRLFINGVQSGATYTTTGVRDPNIGLLRIGCNYNGTAISDFKIDDLMIFSTVQHTSNYTPGYIVPTVYSITNPTIIFSNPVADNQGLELFTESATKPGLDEFKYSISKDGVYYYWDGAAWLASDGTYAQANTAAEIETNKSTFNPSGIGVETIIEMFLHSADGSTTPVANFVTVGVDFYAGDATPPDQCVVYGFCYDDEGNPKDGVEIAINLSQKEVLYKTDLILFDVPQIDLVSDEKGYWDVSLIETVNMDGAKWKFDFSYDGKTKSYIRAVPNEESKNFAKLKL